MSTSTSTASTSTSAYTGVLRDGVTGATVTEAEAYRPSATALAQDVHAYASPVYDLAGTTALPAPGTGPGVFRFASLLPVDPAGPLVSLGEGGTPLVPVPRAGAAVGLPALLVKDESRNPTWSYKDRLAAVAVTKAVQQGHDTVVVASTGNHGAATAAYAARAGLRCVVLTIASVPETMKTLMQSYGADVVAFDDPRDRWVVMRAGVEDRGWVPVSGYLSPPSGSNPFGVDGYKTIAYELWEQLGGRVPDVVVAPVAYGDGTAGMVRGFRDLVDLGLADRVPRMVAAEPFGPHEVALRDGFVPGAAVPTAPTVAFSIGSAMATWQAWDALRATDGAAATADDEQVMRAQATLAASEGLYLEASSIITYAVLPTLVERGVVAASDTVVLLGTSTGLKDVGATAARLAPVPVIAPTLAAFDAVTSATSTATSGEG
ncbi:pyridoxal-phosphate dependent enzyme [Cellulomonas triticagri]|uniref:Pyridoxal-phosphate dependent enzyme n=1 Tax=Cellulomonas triticagri TaxID=2483352 RepID=A0A3M2JBE7_9CELL|nr:pyridoxal-phosphate dependent enzyme [Cellulomonas triticagri]RMI09431.1 pyridoxal-phosphate dependent enzyme [Cellulomonas triticagri]